MARPGWWSFEALDMAVRFDPEVILRVTNPTASTSVVVRRGDSSDWKVIWHRSISPRSKYGGEIDFSSEELGAAFGIHEHMSQEGKALAGELGVTCAEPDKYVRQGRHLNIPNADSGRAVSLRLDLDYLTDVIANWV